MSVEQSKRDFTNIITQAQEDIRHYRSIVTKYFNEKAKAIDEFAADKRIIDFLNTCHPETYTIEHDGYDEVISVMKKIKEDSDDVYLVTLGIKCNDDAIDNNGRSRQDECKRKKRESYSLSQRPWYVQTENDSSGNPLTITMPVRDTSDSYVICVTKLIRDKNGTIIGIVALDYLMRTIASKIKSENHIIIFTKTGEIVYNSEPNIRYVLEKRYNINLLLGPDIMHSARQNKDGCIVSSYEGNECLIAYGPLVKDKYYFICIHK